MTPQQNFIDTLAQKTANYNNPEQAITTANLCNTISRDININRQRFLYELLQNADDASNSTNKLDARIDFVGNYIVVSHKGIPFSKIDIESISSAGDGTKTNDAKKTGFKGIGFKSVFAHSEAVIIKSGSFCFKYDEQSWQNYWSAAWGDENIWKAKRKADGKSDLLKMPWQILPRPAILPKELEHIEEELSNYNVSTIIHYKDIEQLQKDVTELFSESQIVLFLRCTEVSITINGNNTLILEKIRKGDTLSLSKNNQILSEWLIKTIEFDIPEKVKQSIEDDEKSPKKLKEALKTEISFAVQTENGKFKTIEKNNRLIFTYLPTSINYGFPFLVNASFLTDAGRQHLHQDTFWNNWLFEQISVHFLGWLAELATPPSPYKSQILEILPSYLPNNTDLENSFNKGFKHALHTIAFVPNLAGELLKVGDCFFDETGISEHIAKELVLEYFNSVHQTNFTFSSFIAPLKALYKLEKLGSKIFNLDNLDSFICSTIFKDNHKKEDNFKLISFLYQLTKRNNDLNTRLKTTPFIFDEKRKLKSPTHLYFPNEKGYSNDFEESFSFIHKAIFAAINQDPDIKNWLSLLGVIIPSDISFIEKTILGQADFITTKNAIEVGRYLFNAHKEGFLAAHYAKLRNIKILSQKGTLIVAQNAFLSNFYKPELSLEGLYEHDFYASQNYFKTGDLDSEWKTFFIKIGVKQSLECVLHRDYFYSSENRHYYAFIREELKEQCSQYEHELLNLMLYGNSWVNSYILETYKITFSELACQNYDFSKLFWNIILKKITIIHNKAIWRWGRFDRNREYVTNHLIWSIKNSNFIPTTQKTCLKAADVFSPKIPNIKKIAGKYLPVFDYEGDIPVDWDTALSFKKELSWEDYLEILSGIWQDSDLVKTDLAETKERILLVYEKLATISQHTNISTELKNWAASNKLLSSHKGDFYAPKDLSIVTVEGFTASHFAYYYNNNTSKQAKEPIEDLLALFGVKVVKEVKVKPDFPNGSFKSDSLKNKLQHIAPLIALLIIESNNTKAKDWAEAYTKLKTKLQKIYFYETSKILLSYGDENNQIERSTWADESKFYYVGSWYSSRILDGLVEPLGKFLGLTHSERLLIVLLSEKFADGLEYLREKGYNTSLIPEDAQTPEEPETNPNNSQYANRPYNPDDAKLGRQGEEFIYEELKRIYKNKYDSAITDTNTGFNIGKDLVVFWCNKNGESGQNYDFKIEVQSKTIYIESKATTHSEHIDKVALYISANEWQQMETAEKYLIARVYNIGKKPIIRWAQMHKTAFLG